MIVTESGERVWGTVPTIALPSETSWLLENHPQPSQLQKAHSTQLWILKRKGYRFQKLGGVHLHLQTQGHLPESLCSVFTGLLSVHMMAHGLPTCNQSLSLLIPCDPRFPVSSPIPICTLFPCDKPNFSSGPRKKLNSQTPKIKLSFCGQDQYVLHRG